MSIYGSVRPADAPPPKKPKKRLPQPLRGAANFLNEEIEAVNENLEAVKKLRKNPKY